MKPGLLSLSPVGYRLGEVQGDGGGRMDKGPMLRGGTGRGGGGG